MESEKQLLEDDRKPDSKCYLCGCKASDPIHDKKSSNFLHVFSQLKYMLLAGDATISKLDTQKLTSIINSNNNKDGKNVKILVGTSKIKEGLDLI